MRSSVARRHFAQFDDELQDSDQTFSTPARHLRPRARLPTVADASDSSSGRPSRRQFSTSAFFSDTTDDDVSRPITKPSDRSRLSMSAHNRPAQTRNNRSPLHMSAGPRKGHKGTSHVPRLHVSAIQFPATRSVLWDRRQLSAAPIGVSLEQVLPLVIIAAEALKEIYRLYKDKSGVRGSGAALCYLYGDATSTRGKKVLFEGVTMKKEGAKAATWCIPVYTIADGNNPGLSQETYVSTIEAVQSSYRDEYTDNVASKLQPKLLVFRSSPHAAQLDFQLECAASPVLFKFSLVRNLPLLMTPLAGSLAKREFSMHSGNMRSGYLTLDRTRKAVPLLKVDPLVLQQPVVGVWVYGVQIDDAWDKETARRQLADPFLYFACIGYVMSEAIKERVGPEKNTFLVAIYPADDPDSGAVGSLPRFFECSYSEFLSPPSRPLPMELYSHRRSCLVGVSKFSSGVELTLSAAPTNEWEEARRQVKIPTTSCSTDIDDAPEHSVAVSEEEKEDATSGWTITADAIRKSSSRDTKPQSESSVLSEKDVVDTRLSTEDDAVVIQEKTATPISGRDQRDAGEKETSQPAPNETEKKETTGPAQHDWTGNTSSSRSCCKTQQLLTIQHQQILENQQRQLHEMQEQIAQLRRLLHAARSDSNKKQVYMSPNDEGYDSDASSSSIGAVADVSNVSGTFSRHGNEHVSSQSSTVSGPRHNDDGPLSDEAFIHTQQDNVGSEGDEEDNDVSLSSLGLSSISSGSAADLSSLSSSLVGKRRKKLGASQLHGTENANVEEVDPEVDDLSVSQLSQVSKGSQKTAQQPAAEALTGVAAESTIDQETEAVEKSPNAHNVSVGELSSTPTEVSRGTGRAADSDEVDDRSSDGLSAIERLLPPDAYLRKVGGFVDHHGGCFTSPPLDFHSFCVPRIKFSTETPECSMSDSEDEEIRLIEQKYKRLMAV
ncbi:hypothetical protein PPTG_01416 [Phytophthora nicotianae INRA-310]|uniref:STIL N-terminal domain-containing protein n=1 Tax=Phytophthora nicotianae (strain INRA-310) TaxID=761204 RepID=W2R6V4_PHYN3|nr:hypothetical protein PPTG_01416 [Phytophthora nicotianae INRA-310]ETN21138.1 hypothetical protein PPTG_01416 [Phytophthora nicotianae INRA-310]